MKHFSYDITNEVMASVPTDNEHRNGVILAVVIGVALAAALFFSI